MQSATLLGQHRQLCDSSKHAECCVTRPTPPAVWRKQACRVLRYSANTASCVAQASMQSAALLGQHRQLCGASKHAECCVTRPTPPAVRLKQACRVLRYSANTSSCVGRRPTPPAVWGDGQQLQLCGETANTSSSVGRLPTPPVCWWWQVFRQLCSVASAYSPVLCMSPVLIHRC